MGIDRGGEVGAGSGRPPGREDRVVEVVRDALGAARHDLTRAIDDQVLQYACGALQDLQEIHRATPTESLWRAIGNLHNAITALRGLVEAQAGIHADLEEHVRPAVAEALAEGASG